MTTQIPHFGLVTCEHTMRSGPSGRCNVANRASWQLEAVNFFLDKRAISKVKVTIRK
jgi:hypothetical protein